jgi:xylose dehydrogenase (NAD/NADP)
LASPLRLGLLSTARINRRILPAARESELVEVVAVASRDGGRGTAYAREHGIGRAHEGYEALLADPDVDAVYVPLPNSLHVEWTRRALEAGKHVLCEKPLTDEPDDAEALFDLAEREGLVLVEGFMYRHNPQTRRVEELVRGGAIGRLQLVRTSFSFPVEGAENIRLDPGLDGGALLDLGAYCVSGARLLAGEPESVLGRQVIGPTGVDDLFTGSLVFPEGFTPSSTAACVFPRARRSRRSATGARSSWTTPGSAAVLVSSCAAATASSGSPSSRPTPTGSSWTTSRARSPARGSRSWAARTPSRRPECSQRFAARPSRASRFGPRVSTRA